MFVRARDNPFRSERVLEVRYRPIGTTWPALLERLASLRYRAAIIGPQGFGKTTLLEDLVPRLEGLGFTSRFHRLDRQSPAISRQVLGERVSNVDGKTIILLDGCEQLSPRAWRHFLTETHSAAGLIITTHRAGRLPTLVECQTNSELLREIVSRLAGPELADSIDAQSLLDHHNGNIREAIGALYDDVAGKSACPEDRRVASGKTMHELVPSAFGPYDPGSKRN